ncbi:MAG: pentapeptide repeat-containing protein [Bacteroidota bacterium]
MATLRTTTADMQDIIENYKVGHRYFLNIHLNGEEKLVGQILVDVIFDNCSFSIDFSQTDFTNSKFSNCDLKSCDFTKCNLTNTVFENCYLENAEFKKAKMNGTILNNCHIYGKAVMLNTTTGQLETFKDPLVKELYDYVPEFSNVVDHMDDELSYSVYGDLSRKLFDDITTNKETTIFTRKCFQFFNLIADRNDERIDSLLIDVYEGLYASKKCNDIVRQLLTGRNKDIYEHWMKNGNIQSNY